MSDFSVFKNSCFFLRTEQIPLFGLYTERMSHILIAPVASSPNVII